jgi:hypothetical protein
LFFRRAGGYRGLGAIKARRRETTRAHPRFIYQPSMNDQLSRIDKCLAGLYPKLEVVDAFPAWTLRRSGAYVTLSRCAVQ